jgi:radical SAM superfamily enzyme YgiQ (UPF0313 family)
VDVVLLRANDKKKVYNGIPSEATASDPPYWLAVMGGYLRREKLETALIDAEAEDLSNEAVCERLMRYHPRLVGILTVGSNLTASTWKMDGSGALSDDIKRKFPDVPIFLWGNHPSALPEVTLRGCHCDSVVACSAFDAVADLANGVKNGRAVVRSGIWSLKNNQLSGDGIIRTIRNLDELPLDGWEMLLSQTVYRNHFQFALEDIGRRNRYGVILTSLGCPYHCAFCSVSVFSGKSGVRYKSVERCMEEIDYQVQRNNAYYIRVLDETFTTNRKHVMDFCEALKERGQSLSLWCYARTDQVDPEMLANMYEAGFRWVCYGFESGNQAIRDKVHKGQYSQRRVEDAVKITHEAGLSVLANFMFGLPGDTLESMRDTLSLARELNCEFINFSCTMAYPGSELYREALTKGIELPETWLGYAQLSYETQPLPTETLSSAEVLRFRDYAFNAFFENNPGYWAMIESKFGQPAVDAIHKMLEGRIKRKLLGD